MTERVNTRLHRALQRVVRVETDEVRLLLWSAAFFFFVLASNLVVRAVRGQIGVSAGREVLPELFAATFVAMMVANWLYWSLVNRVPKRRFVPITYHAIAASLLILYALLRLAPEGAQDTIKFTLFVWYSVINLFAVCLFWVCVVDTFTNEQGKRLFAFIGVGGTLGGITGSVVAAAFVEDMGSDALLLLSIGFLEIGVFCSARLLGHSRHLKPRSEQRTGTEFVASGGVLTGLKLAAGSPYLRSIALYIFLMSCLGTAIYFQQVEIIGDAYSLEDQRTEYSATVDAIAQSLTLIIQLFVTARLLRFVGVRGTLMILPAVTALGVLVLGFLPLVPVLAVVQVLFASGRYSIAKPAREILFTIVGKEEKYKSKSFTDTFTPRMGDLGASWAFGALPAALLAWTALPLAVVWTLIGSRVGRMHRQVPPGSARRGGM